MNAECVTSHSTLVCIRLISVNGSSRVNVVLRESGIAAIGTVAWGTHLCQFYETRDDCFQALIPYFKAGLEAGEYCVWVLSQPSDKSEALAALGTAVPDIAARYQRGDIDLRYAAEWYRGGNAPHISDVSGTWGLELATCLEEGHRGVRVGENCGWPDANDRNPVCRYERVLGKTVTDRRMLSLCTYPLANRLAIEVLDVARMHHFAVVCQGGAWDVIHGPALTHDAGSESDAARLRRRPAPERRYRAGKARASRRVHLVGESAAIREVLERVAMVAQTDAAVLITGESGTGKELVARAIHEASGRVDRSMVKVSCASVPRDLFESEFFGHVKGAFTSALRDRDGRFQLAHQGTIFLDEVGEIPLELQSKLLRVLQEGQFERVGEDLTRSVDVRVIAATNRDLPGEVDAGRFRKDLYYRLFVFPIHVVPLREHPEDIPALAAHFMRIASRTFNRPDVRLTDENIAGLMANSWIGNVRELYHAIERAVILTCRGELRLDLVLGNAQGHRPLGPVIGLENGDQAILAEEDVRRYERNNILVALNRANWRIYGPGGAADLLGVRPTTLASRLKRLGIVRPR